MKTLGRFLITLLVAQTANAITVDLDVNSIGPVVQKSLNFVSQEQFAEDSGYYSKGEWTVHMKSYFFPAVVGLGRTWGRPSEEPTAFATSSIVNIVSEAYLLNPKLQVIPSIIEKAIPSLEGYREGDVFYYYPVVDFKEFQGQKFHAPRDPRYVPRKMLQFAMVPPDADTTSVSFTALAFADQIQNQKPMSSFKVPDATLKTFSDFRDVGRSPHIYNRLTGVKKSGAFLTWLWDEKAKTSSFFNSMKHKPIKGYRIVFGTNDVDCVVNANVLRLLTLTSNQNQEGYGSSCQLLNSAILESRTDSCGVYYPNTYNPLYTISAAYKAGASCLNESRDQAVEFLLSRQNEDGSWSNEPGIGREDRVQSTAWALSALLNYVDIRDRRYFYTVQSAVHYLLSQAKTKSGDQTYWRGEVFFSGSAAARNTLLWRSNSYTTAMVLLSLVKAEIYLKNEVSR